ncbi:MAG: hypothetical protein ACREJC_03530 [Tepidisphaeraceae bacterium]
MDKKLFGIGTLSLTAVVLMVANFIPVRTAPAGVSVKDRDYTLVTTLTTQGDDALYIADNRTGLIGVFTWDTQARTIRVRDIRPVSDAFE